MVVRRTHFQNIKAGAKILLSKKEKKTRVLRREREKEKHWATVGKGENILQHVQVRVRVDKRQREALIKLDILLF